MYNFNQYIFDRVNNYNKGYNVTDFHILAAFSNTNYHNGEYHTIASTFFKLGEFKINLKNLLNKLELLEVEELIIYNISSSDNVEDKFIKLNESSEYKLWHYDISFNAFFSDDTINKLFHHKNRTKYIIFHFDKYEWRTILEQFKRFNIIVSGGSNTKRHILSGVQHKLSQFLICIGQDNLAINTSLHIANRQLNRATVDFTSKEMTQRISKMDKLIREIEDRNKIEEERKRTELNDLSSKMRKLGLTPF